MVTERPIRYRGGLYDISPLPLTPLQEIKPKDRVVTAALQLLESVSLDPIKGKSVIIKIPFSKQVYRITDISETNATKKKIENNELLVSRPAIRIESFKNDKPQHKEYWIAFPLPVNTESTEDTSHAQWCPDINLRNREMKRLARHLERAVAKRKLSI